MIQVAYKYRIYPNKEQKIYFAKCFGCVRFFYNHSLSDMKDIFDKEHKFENITPARYKDDYAFLKEVDSLALANAQMNRNVAFKSFFRHQNDYPKYKSKKNEQSYSTNNQKGSVRFSSDGKYLTIPKCKNIKVKKHRNFLGTIKTVTISKTTDDKYYLRRTALKDLEYKTDLRFDIIFIVCAVVIYGLVFILIGQTNKANGPIDYTVKTQEYSYVKPEGYVATVGEDENSSILFPKHDITGNSGAIYFSIFNITNPTQISEASELESLKSKYSALPEIQDYKSETSTNSDGNYVISNIMTFADHFETADYIYLTNQAGACEKVILIESRYFDANSPVATDAKSIVNSVDNLLK
mgnify:CR=1 FL=1